MTTPHTRGVTTLDVIVPTYRRPQLLARCLRALAQQTRAPECVIVVARADDEAARDIVDRCLGQLGRIELVTVREPGVLAAMMAGVANSTGDVIAFTDDDAAPHANWLEQVCAHFDDPSVGGVGGRDIIPGQEQPLTGNVGQFRRSGRLTGLHHLGTGPARDVDVLKGVNMAFRAEAFALPAEGVLRGRGAQVDFEVITCAWARQQGWRLVYDPSIRVDHEGAARQGTDRRRRPAPSAVFDAAFNSVVAASSLGSSALARHAVYGLLVGTSDRPGAIRTGVAGVRGEWETVRRSLPSLAGRLFALAGMIAFKRRRSPPIVTAGELRHAGGPRPRVALVAHDIHDGGGMERAYAELIRGLASKVDFTVVSATLAPDLRPLVTWRRVRILRRPFVAKFVMFWLLAPLHLARTGRVDLVQTLGAIIPNRSDLATLQFCHAGFRRASGHLAPRAAPPLRRVNTTIARTLALLGEQWCYRASRLRRFVAVSQGVGVEAARSYPGIPVMTITNGVDPAVFSPDDRHRAAVRSEFGADREVVALFVGGDWDRKGLAIAIEATAKARTEGANVVLWVVGEGDQERFGQLAGQFGVEDSVRFFGRRSETDRFYRAADLFVFPTAYEAFSLAMLEAAASGLPLVAPHVNGVAELVGDGGGGIVVARSADAVAGALAALAADPTRRATLGAAARERAERFTWARAAGAHFELYAALVAEAGR